MKKLILLFAISLSAVLVASAQKTPPAAVSMAFKKQFPDVKKTHWGKEKNGEWEAEFDVNKVETTANFSADGKWVETETEINFSDLPTAVQTALKGKKVKEAAKIMRADGSTVYEAEVKRKDWLFDATGKKLN